jgi:WhiB family redox-sensing transcriptional regulator
VVDDWRELAPCAAGTSEDKDRWYSEDVTTIKMVKRICHGCPGRAECLALALSFPAVEDQWGVFGGLDPNQRRRLRKAVA